MTSRALVPVDPSAAKVALVWFAHPFAEPRRAEFPAGHAAAVYLRAAEAMPPAEIELVALVDGAPTARGELDAIAPARVVVAQLRPGFGGDLGGVLASVASLALAVAVPPLGAAMGLGVLGTAALGVGAGLLGSLALNALAPPPEGRGPEGGHLYDISRQSNQARLHAPVPVILGRRRVYPDLAAPLLREPHGDRMFVRALYCFGAGEYAISDLEIGGAPIQDVIEAEWQVRDGSAGGAPITLYADSVDEDEIAAEVLKSSDWVRRQTRVDAAEIRVLIDFPEGLFHLNKRGEAENYRLDLSLRYRKLGASAWTYLLSNQRIAANRRAYRLAYHWKVEEDPGQYEVELRRHTDDDISDTRNYSLLVWRSLQTIRHAPAIENPDGLALLALRLEATQSFSGAVGAISAIVATVALDWDADARAWVKRPTRNPASLFRYVAQHPASAFPLADDDLALDELEDWAERCAEKGWTYDRVFDGAGTVEDALRDIAAIGRASPHLRPDGKLGVVRDGPRSAPAQMVGPETAADLQIERVWRDLPHGLICEYVDPDRGWTSSEVTAYRDGWGPTNATLFERLRLDAVTDRAMAWRLGRYHLAQAQLRPDRFRWTTDVESLAIRRGDMVVLAWPTDFVGLASGRVKALGLDGEGRAIEVEIDEEIPASSGALAMRARAADGAMEVRAVAELLGPRRARLASSFAIPLEPGCLVFVGEAGGETELVITEIRPKGDLAADVTAVRHAPEIEDADLGAIPPYDPRLSLPPAALARPDAPILGALAIGLDRSRQTGDFRLAIVVPLRFPPSLRAPIDRIEARWREAVASSWATDAFSPDKAELELAPVERAKNYVVQVRAVADASGRRLASPWVEASIAIAAEAFTPGPPTGLSAITVVDANLDGVLTFGVEARWDAPAIEPAYFELAWRQSEGLHDDGTGFFGVNEPAYDEPGEWRAEPLLEGRERVFRIWRVRDQSSYAFRLRALGALGDPSAWTPEVLHEVQLGALPQRRPANLVVFGGPRAFRMACAAPLDPLWRKVRFYFAATDDRAAAEPISPMLDGRSFSYAAAETGEAGYFWARAFGPGDRPGGWNAEAGTFAKVGSLSLAEIEESAGKYFAAEPGATASGVGANAIANAGFELGAVGWRFEDEAHARIAGGGGRYGPAALEVDALADGDNVRIHHAKWLDVRPGEAWSVGCDAKRLSGEPGAFLAVNWRDETGARIGGESFPLFKAGQAAEAGWRRFDFRAVAPTAASRASLYVASAQGVAGALAIDGVRFSRRPEWDELEGEAKPQDNATATAIGRTWLFNGDFEAGLGVGDVPIGWHAAPFASGVAAREHSGGRHGSNCVRLDPAGGQAALPWLGVAPPKSGYLRADEGDALVLRLYQRTVAGGDGRAALRVTALSAASDGATISSLPSNLWDAPSPGAWRRWRRKVALPTGTRFVAIELVATGVDPVWVDAIDVLEAPPLDDVADAGELARADKVERGDLADDVVDRVAIAAPVLTDLRATQWGRDYWVDLAEVEVTTRGFDVVLDWWGEVRCLPRSSGAIEDVRLRLLRDGAVIMPEENVAKSTTWTQVSRMARDRPAAGRHSYTLQARYGWSFSPAGEGRKFVLRALESSGAAR